MKAYYLDPYSCTIQPLEGTKQPTYFESYSGEFYDLSYITFGELDAVNDQVHALERRQQELRVETEAINGVLIKARELRRELHQALQIPPATP